MARLTPDEAHAFLTAEARTAKLATTRADGSPHVVPVWFALDGEDLDDLLRWATPIGARHLGEARAEEFGRRNAVPGELLVPVVPTKVVGVTELAG